MTELNQLTILNKRYVLISPPESTDARISRHEADVEQAGRLHGIVLSRVHLRA